jgi:hypothetical protein
MLLTEMLNEALRRNDVLEVCKIVANYFTIKNGHNKLVADFRAFFIEEILHTRNMYVLEFYLHKIHVLRTRSGRIQRITAVELGAFLATCSRAKKPSSENKSRNKQTPEPLETVFAKNVQQALQHGTFDETTIRKNIFQLVKENPDIVDRMWSTLEQITPHKNYVRHLKQFVEHPKENPLLLYQGFTTIDTKRQFQRNVKEYSNVVIQCMLKAELLFEALEVFDREELLYNICLYYCPKQCNAPEKHKAPTTKDYSIRNVEV